MNTNLHIYFLQDGPTDQPTDRLMDVRGQKEVTFPAESKDLKCSRTY